MSKQMTLNDYQDQTSKTAIFPSEIPEFVDSEVVYTTLGMVGEAGECAEKVKKAIREEDPSYLEDLEDELGDVLWYWAQVAEQLDLEAEEIAENNLEKLLDRQERGQLTGEGDDR